MHIWRAMSSFGVDLFFVLSGRLMAEILFVKKSPLPIFFVRRISRIFPALLIFVVITTLAFRGTELSHGIGAAATALTMTLNYAMIYFHPIGLLDHLWSLCVEEHSYIILAVIAFFSAQRSFKVGILIALIGLASLINGVIRLDIFDQSILLTRWRTEVSLAGIFISAALWMRFRSLSLSPLVSPVALAVAVICRIQSTALLFFGFSTVALALAVVALDTSPMWWRKTLAFKPLKTVGLWSYSLYLWQQPFYKLHHFGGWSLPLALFFTLVCALASFYFIEHPARRLINIQYDKIKHRHTVRENLAPEQRVM